MVDVRLKRRSTRVASRVPGVDVSVEMDDGDGSPDFVERTEDGDWERTNERTRGIGQLSTRPRNDGEGRKRGREKREESERTSNGVVSYSRWKR